MAELFPSRHDTSTSSALTNLNEDEGGGPSEDEYDALNDETFGGDGSEFDWEEEHEQLAQITETSRRHKDDHLDVEASLSKLVLDDNDAPTYNAAGSSVWSQNPMAPNSVSALRNVCTVEELERQLRQSQPQQQQQQPGQNFYQPRFPMILQRPPGLQAPVPLPFAPQQPMNQAMQQINHMNQNHQPLQQLLGQNNQMGPNTNQMMQSLNQMAQNSNQMGSNPNQMGPNPNQMGPNPNHMGPNPNQMGPNPNQMGPNPNQMGPNPNQMGPNPNQIGPNLNQIGPNPNQIGPNLNQIGPNANQMGPNHSQIGPNTNPMGPNANQMGPNANQMGPNVNQMGPSINQIGPNPNQMGLNSQMMNGNQFGPGQMGPNQLPMMPPHMMGPRILGPPPGLNNVPRQNFNPSLAQFNQNFRGPMEPQLNKQPNMMLNQPQMLNQQQMLNQAPSVQQLFNNQQQLNQQNQQINQPANKHNQQPLIQHSPPQNQPLNQQLINQNQQFNNQNQQFNSQNQQFNNQSQLLKSKTPQKNQLQRSLVFNNSNQKNMSSQNLVQMIQSTHPMLQMHNSSFHNASHHPVLNIRTNVFNNAQNNHPMFSNQRNNAGYSNSNNRYMNGDDGGHHGGEYGDGQPRRDASDEYAGLMNQREKHWLLNIQMLQLNTGTPYMDDFYYTVFLDRQAKKEKEHVKEAHKANQQNHPFYSGNKESTGRERHNSVRHNSTSEDQPTPRTYVPTQFENSLGKLQCGSVTAPRKIIDVEVVQSEAGVCSSGRQSRAASVASTTHQHEGPREVRRTKQALLDIEALYLVLLRLEELNDPLAISNALILKEREEKARLADAERSEEAIEDSNLFLRNIESVQRRPAAADSDKTLDKRQVVSLTTEPAKPQLKNLLDENKDDLMNRMFAGLLHEDRLPLYCGIRKGKMLIQRFVTRVPATHPRLRAFWSRVLRALPAAARRDAREDNILPKLTPAFNKYISNSTGWAAILEACAHLAEALDPARTPHALLTPFTLSCVCVLMQKASTLINTTEASSSERQWTKFLKSLARTLKNTPPAAIAKPSEPLAQPAVADHVRLLESKTTVEILKRGRTAAEFADLTKNEFGEILVKYLS